MNETTIHFRRVQTVFDEIVALPAERWDEGLNKLCDGDARLRSDVGSLLSALAEESKTSGQLRETSAQPGQALAHSRIGPYELEQLLGRGGMGAVYLAHRADGEYTKKVAIKLIDLPLATNLFRERFRHERQILAGLDHPLIARMLDGGVSSGGDPYLVMEYVQGESIHAFCTKRGLSLQDRVKLFQGVCEAVQFAHQNLVVHRDLKPENILVDSEGRPHLLDFGTAKLLSASDADTKSAFTREGFLSFTPQYASPEQVLGKSITTASDTYSLGVLLYLLLSNKLPYELKEFSTEEMVRVICDQPPRKIVAAAEFKTELGADLEAIVNKALRKEPERRYGTAQQIQDDLQNYLDSRPVSARQGTLQYKTVKFIKRNRTSFAIACLLTLSLLVGSVAVLWQARIANQQRRIAVARSTDLRELSNSLLSELDEAIKQIPGSTSAQQLLVTRVLQHLDRMAEDTRGDKLAESDLAEAYTRLGKLQGDGYEQNLGDKAGASKSLDKAVAIAVPLANAYPRDPAVLTVLAQAQEARGEVLSLMDDNRGAAEALQAALNTYEQLLALPGATPQLYFDAGETYDIYGDLLGQDIGFSDDAGAMENYRKAIDLDNRALALDPNFMRVKRGLVTMQMKVGNVQMETDPSAALSNFTNALNAYSALPQAERERLNMQRLHAVLLRKQATTLSELERYVEAAPIFRESFAIYKRLADLDPKDVRAVADVNRELQNEAASYMSAGESISIAPALRERNLRRAEELYMEQEAVLQKLIHADAKDSASETMIRFIHVRLGRIHNLLREEYPEQLARTALAGLKREVASDGTSPMTLDLAVTAFLEAEPGSIREPAYTVLLAERGDNLTHHKSPKWSLSLAQAYRANGQTIQAKSAGEHGLSFLADAQKENRNYRLRQLLQRELLDK